MPRRNVGALLAALLVGSVAGVGSLVMELSLIGWKLRGHVEPGQVVSWDPVSLWRQSTLGKLMIAAPLVTSAVVFGVAFWFVYRRVALYSHKVGTGVQR